MLRYEFEQYAAERGFNQFLVYENGDYQSSALQEMYKAYQAGAKAALEKETYPSGSGDLRHPAYLAAMKFIQKGVDYGFAMNTCSSLYDSAFMNMDAVLMRVRNQAIEECASLMRREGQPGYAVAIGCLKRGG